MAETKDRESIGAIKNVGRGGCHALCFYGKWSVKVI